MCSDAWTQNRNFWISLFVGTIGESYLLLKGTAMGAAQHSFGIWIVSDSPTAQLHRERGWVEQKSWMIYILTYTTTFKVNWPNHFSHHSLDWALLPLDVLLTLLFFDGLYKALHLTNPIETDRVRSQSTSVEITLSCPLKINTNPACATALAGSTVSIRSADSIVDTCYCFLETTQCPQG